MLTISRPLSVAQLRTYHATEFSNGRANYYTTEEQIVGQWHGQLAARWGLAGDVREDHFQRLAEGQHPVHGDQLIRIQPVHAYVSDRGHHRTTLDHRAGWDATFSAPKSVSLTALVGGDTRVLEAHRASVGIALDELERYTQARIGRNHPAETTRAWIAARFEHDSARPVDGYAAPQLHTHVVVFNITERPTGEPRALQPRELYRTQQLATAVYRSELARRLTALGYAIDRGTSGQPDIRGYTADYLETSSPRRQQIEDHLASVQRTGAAAAQIAAHQTRENKAQVVHGDMRQRHQELARRFGNQPARVVGAALTHEQPVQPVAPRITAGEAVRFARDRNIEREARIDERVVLRDAVTRTMGEISTAALKHELDDAIRTGVLIRVESPPGSPARAFTTDEMKALERHTIARMRAGQGRRPSLVDGLTPERLQHRHPQLTDHQRLAVQQMLASRDQVVALDGIAGAGKTTTLAAIRQEADRAGYRVRGFAPTSRAAQKLEEAGIASMTLQRHLARMEPLQDNAPYLYVLDESSLASTRQMHAFLNRLNERDRVLLVGDARQHQAVEAGRPYEQLHEAGIAIAHLQAIVRQDDPALKQVVEHLAAGDVRLALHDLDRQGRIHEVATRAERFATIAEAFAREPERTLVIAPDNQARQDLNVVIRQRLQAHGIVASDERPWSVLAPRQELTGPDRHWAGQYERGDVIRYTRGSHTMGLARGAYAWVESVDRAGNRLTVVRQDGSALTYEPTRLHGVTVYAPSARAFAVGDRVQFTAPLRPRQIANRELGVIDAIAPDGLRIRLDRGRTVTITPEQARHLDYGYAVTSHSSQGQTADRVLIHIDTDEGSERLLNRRLAYVAISRARHDVQIYTNAKRQLGDVLSREVSHTSALSPSEERAAGATTPDRTRARAVDVAIG
jgi:conjugative relaxase-like TrwC/TraI family protein